MELGLGQRPGSASSVSASLSAATINNNDIEETQQRESGGGGRALRRSTSSIAYSFVSSVHSRVTTSLGTNSISAQGRELSNGGDPQRGHDDGDDEETPPDEEDVADERRLYQAVRDAGRYSTGVSAVEVWILEESSSTNTTSIVDGGRGGGGGGHRLVRPDGGWWRSPDFQADSSAESIDALDRIENRSRDDYVPPSPQIPGTDLAGKLWFELQATASGDHHHRLNFPRPNWGHGHAVGRHRKSAYNNGDMGGQALDRSSRSMDGSLKSTWFASFRSDPGVVFGIGKQRKNRRKRRRVLQQTEPVELEYDDNDLESKPSQQLEERAGGGLSINIGGENEAADNGRNASSDNDSSNDETWGRRYGPPPPLLWRDIHSLTVDPDQPTFERLGLLEEAGFRRAAGVRFDANGGNTRGLVVYLATQATFSSADPPGGGEETSLSDVDNCAYMRSAAEYVGAAVAMTRSRKKVVVRLAAARAIASAYAGGGDGADEHEDNRGSKKKEERNSRALRGVKIWVSKWGGGDLQPPPPMSSGESSLAFLGSLTTLLILARISEALSAYAFGNGGSGGPGGLILGPFGALVTLQYGLTMAPASQPRNVVYGLGLAVTIALLFAYIPESRVPLWVRVPFATATAITALVRLGITHPPAGAAALIVSSGGYSWMDLPLIVLAGIITIAIATLVNNVSERRQYPTYYRFFGGSKLV